MSVYCTEKFIILFMCIDLSLLLILGVEVYKYTGTTIYECDAELVNTSQGNVVVKDLVNEKEYVFDNPKVDINDDLVIRLYENRNGIIDKVELLNKEER